MRAEGVKKVRSRSGAAVADAKVATAVLNADAPLSAGAVVVKKYYINNII
jgi:hypothetical protein